MKRNPPPDHAEFRRLQELDNLETLKASYERHVFPRHFHDTYVIEFVEQGVDEFTCDGVTYRAPAGSLVLINPYEVHTGRSVGSRCLKYRSLYPCPKLMSDICSQLQDMQARPPVFPSHVVHDPRTATLICDFLYTCEKNSSRLEVETRLWWALSVLIARHADASFPIKQISSERTPIRKTVDYIDAYYPESITLAQLTLVSGLSPFHLLRAFRKEVGLPPHEYLVNVRIEHARTLLCSGHPIARVAYETGFTDQSHLTRLFKRSIGITPGQFIA